MRGNIFCFAGFAQYPFFVFIRFSTFLLLHKKVCHFSFSYFVYIRIPHQGDCYILLKICHNFGYEQWERYFKIEPYLFTKNFFEKLSSSMWQSG